MRKTLSTIAAGLMIVGALMAPASADEEPTPSPTPVMASPVAVTESNPVTPVETTVEDGPASLGGCVVDAMTDDLLDEVDRERARGDRLALKVERLRLKVERLRATR